MMPKQQDQSGHGIDWSSVILLAILAGVAVGFLFVLNGLNWPASFALGVLALVVVVVLIRPNTFKMNGGRFRIEIRKEQDGK
jgi:hypothetical protein